MRSETVGFFATVFATLALGQSQPATGEKLLYFAHTDVPRDMQEIGQVVRTTLELREAAVSDTQRSLAIRGTQDQIAAAEWLFAELDRTPIVPRQHSTNHGYVLPGDKEGIIRIFYAAYTADMREFQELAQLVRTVPEARRTFTYNGLNAIIVRGTPPQVRLAESLFDELDKPSTTLVKHAASPQFFLPGDKEGVTRVFYVAHAKTVPAFQEIAKLLRETVLIRRVFTNNPHRAIIARGTPEEVAITEWLFDELDQPRTGSLSEPSREIRMPSGRDFMRVFYLPGTGTTEEFQDVAAKVKAATWMVRAIAFNNRRALVVRGTADELAAAERIVNPN
jgi:hypothetical protein